MTVNTETLVDIHVHYRNEKTGEARKRFRLESAAARFIADTPSAYRIDRTTTVIEWLKPAEHGESEASETRHDSFLPA
jgi:hypothetical protein